MYSDLVTNSEAQERERGSELRLRDGEQLLAEYPTMLSWHAMLWILLLFGSSGSGLGIAMMIGWLAPGGEGLNLYDRVLRLVLKVNEAIFGRHSACLTSQRLVVLNAGQPAESYPLGNIAGTETRTFRLSGNLFVHLRGATKRRLGLWVVRCGEVAEQLHAVCQGQYKR
jgi:hypothetical protein